MKILSLAMITLAIAVLPAYGGGAHCYCKVGLLSSPIRDFGEIEHWATQIGHDGACRDSCNTKADAYMRDPNNRTAACNSTHGAPVVAFFAVGTRAYQAGGTYNCPQSNPTPAPGRVSFPPRDHGTTPRVTVNDIDIDTLAAPPLWGKLPTKGPFATFDFRDRLSLHAQSWTLTARLYRDNVLVEELTGKSPTASAPDIWVTFTEQPNSFVHGHTWKVTTHYAGPGYGDRSIPFQIAP